MSLVRTPSPHTAGSDDSAETGETPDTTWEPESEDDFVEALVDRVAHPLWLIARALARLADVPFSELEQEDEDGSEFSAEDAE